MSILCSYFCFKNDVIKGNIGMSYTFLDSYNHQKLFDEVLMDDLCIFHDYFNLSEPKG